MSDILNNDALARAFNLLYWRGLDMGDVIEDDMWMLNPEFCEKQDLTNATIDLTFSFKSFKDLIERNDPILLLFAGDALEETEASIVQGHIIEGAGESPYRDGVIFSNSVVEALTEILNYVNKVSFDKPNKEIVHAYDFLKVAVPDLLCFIKKIPHDVGFKVYNMCLEYWTKVNESYRPNNNGGGIAGHADAPHDPSYLCPDVEDNDKYWYSCAIDLKDENYVISAHFYCDPEPRVDFWATKKDYSKSYVSYVDPIPLSSHTLPENSDDFAELFDVTVDTFRASLPGMSF